MKKTLIIAGATGFIGRWIIEKFKDDYNLIALTRNRISNKTSSNVIWREVDLYSISSTQNALSGGDYAIYLVHSMQPSTRLNQGKFEDTDLLLADNFSRAAEKKRLKQIIYLGGIIPKDRKILSKHLFSRLEVEKTLGSRATPLTSIRAGIIIGPGGSSFQIIKNLIINLPIMACPKWTKSLNQPIDVFDILSVIRACIGNKEFIDRKIEVGGNKVLSYMDLLKLTSKLMNKKRVIFSIPFFTLGLSKLWVSLFTGSNLNFVSPLVESLKHKMIPEINSSINKLIKTDIVESIRNAISNKIPVLPNFDFIQKEKNNVRSVQRIYNPSLKSVLWIANEYPIWIKKKFIGIIKARFDGEYLKFSIFSINLLELKLIEDRSNLERQLYYITGGFLVKRRDYGWLEFRSILDGKYIIVAIHEYVPKLPWILYKYFQALAHIYVMKSFENYLSKLK